MQIVFAALSLWGLMHFPHQIRMWISMNSLVDVEPYIKSFDNVVWYRLETQQSWINMHSKKKTELSFELNTINPQPSIVHTCEHIKAMVWLGTSWWNEWLHLGEWLHCRYQRCSPCQRRRLCALWSSMWGVPGHAEISYIYIYYIYI